MRLTATLAPPAPTSTAESSNFGGPNLALGSRDRPTPSAGRPRAVFFITPSPSSSWKARNDHWPGGRLAILAVTAPEAAGTFTL
ncbi:hypothetical protein DMC25_12200 [Caulobacter sp. D4A]|nr:hypothetical protein DMC25_12200 [Caulobacter sp. D4A]